MAPVRQPVMPRSIERRVGRSTRSRDGGRRRLDPALVRVAAALLALAGGGISALAVALPGGRVATPLHDLIALALGWASPLLPAWLLGAGLVLVGGTIRPEWRVARARLAGALLATLALIGLLHLLPPVGEPLARARAGEGGGYLGYALSTGLVETVGATASWTVLLLALALGATLAADLSFTQVAAALRRLLLALLVVVALAGRALRGAWSRLRSRPRVQQPAIRVRPQGRLAGLVRRRPQAQPVLAPAPAEPARAVEPGVRRYQLPPVTLLEVGTNGELSEVDLRHRARTIEETLASFNVTARVVEINPGPAVTQFGLEPGPGVAVSRILARTNDLALRLGASPIRLEAPVPGKRLVGIEVPNSAVSVVNLRGLLESDEYARVRSKLRLPLGRDVSGRAVVADLTKMPHLLIAGATGSGKSVCINTLIAALLFQCTPDELQFLMIDPKMVELAGYNGIPHLRMPVVTDMDRVVGTLKWAVAEMERRYNLFVNRGVRNLEGYNRAQSEAGEPRLPYLVVVIDELADMMMTAPDEVERALCRLAQLARATGIHLIVATQRPSVDVLTGLIKANFPTRIAFAVTSQVDSRVILDTAGAEKLLGRGDMLYLASDSARSVRVQGAFVSDAEINRLIDYWRRLGVPQYSDEDLKQIEALSRPESASQDDELYERAVELAGQVSRLSVSFLQRRLGIGYNRAARIMDLLVQRGVVAGEDGKPRDLTMGAPEEAG